ncbi:MAG: hypothetical protein ABUL53_05915, partial [Bradyrhizobium guangdongense]
MMALRAAAAATLVVLGVDPAFAEVPAAAMNKTVTISFTATGSAKRPDGVTVPFNTSVTRTVYISSAGRLFMRHAASNAKLQATRGGDFDPAAQSAGKGGSFSFQGNRLVGVLPYNGGARQISATFDANFSSCTASVIEGNAGSGSFKRKAPNGVVMEISNASTTGV